MEQRSGRGEPVQAAREKRSFAIAWVLPAILAGLVIATVTPILATTYLINQSNADALLSARAELLVDSLETQVRGLLDPVVKQLETARSYIERRGLDVDDEKRFQTYIEGLMGGTPQVAGIGFIRPDGSMRRWEREREGAIEEAASDLPLVGEALAAAPSSRTTTWSAPFVSPVLDDTILNPRMTIRRGDEVYGILSAGVTGQRLSKYVSELSDDEVTAFILYDRDRIIAYPGNRPDGAEPTSTALPTIAESSIAAIRDMWNEQNTLTQITRMERTDGHWARIGGIPHAFFYRVIEDYAPGGLLVGVVIPSAESRWFRWAPTIAAGFGALLLLGAVLIAARLGRRIARPVIHLEDALGKLETMDFDKVRLPEMSGSRIAEWQSSARRLTKTARSLASFKQYVPDTLSRRLMASPDDAAAPQERIITVMFIDMEGFTAFAARRPAPEVAARLNAVFALIGPFIEGSGGVIDKYTGDGLMAFWGAPDVLEDHAHRAVNTALRISKAYTALLDDPALDDMPRLRIGISHGPAIVGNLGFEGRWNYTLVGKTVNTAERIEQGLRHVHPECAVIIGLCDALSSVVGREFMGENVVTVAADRSAAAVV